jgi:hypothetical protein
MFNTESTRPIQSTSPHPTSTRSILILFNHLRLRLPIGLLPSGIPTNNLYGFLYSPIRVTCPAHLILLALAGKSILQCFIKVSQISKTEEILARLPQYLRSNNPQTMWNYLIKIGGNDSIDGWGVMLKTGRSRLRVPMRSLMFSIRLILSAAPTLWGLLSI